MLNQIMRQIEFKLPSRGGKRRGAGRKPAGVRAGVPHRCRDKIDRHVPAHVTLKLRPGIWNLRSDRLFARIRLALEAKCRVSEAFRIVHFSVQHDHLHLIVEANDAQSFARGVQGLAIRIACAVNRIMHRSGKVPTFYIPFERGRRPVSMASAA